VGITEELLERANPERLKAAFEQYRHAVWHDVCRKLRFTCQICGYSPTEVEK
jgi:hypothetical protein